MGGQADRGLKSVIFASSFDIKRTVWLVKDEKGKLLYTIQRRAWTTDCRSMGLIDCKAVWKIFQGEDKSKTLINYGIQHKAFFGFYRSREEFKSGNATTLAEFRKTLPTKANGNSLYEVKVKPGKDAALFLLAAYAVSAKNDLVDVKEGVVVPTTE